MDQMDRIKVYIGGCGNRSGSLGLFILFLLILFMFLTSEIARGAEAEISITRLKGGEQTSPTPTGSVSARGSAEANGVPSARLIDEQQQVRATGTLENPVVDSEPPNKYGTDTQKQIKAQGEGESSASPGAGRLTGSVSESAGEGEDIPAGDKEPAKIGWDENPDRGKPPINIPLTIASLVLVCLLAYGGIKLYGMYAGVGSSSSGLNRNLMKIREKKSLSPGKQLCLVELPGKVVLIGISDNDMKTLVELDPEKIEEMDIKTNSEYEARPSPASYLTDVLMRRWGHGSK